jgi:DHA2 family multidrug resistance protein
MAVVLAPAIGPTLGGWITDNYSWRWVFFINLPVGIASLFLTYRIVQDPPWVTKATKEHSAIDFVGLALVAIGLGSLEVVLDKGQEDDWFNSHFIVGFSIAAVVAIVAFVVWELRTKNPIVEMRLFKNRTFALSNLMMLVLGVTLFGSTVLLPQFVQTILGWSATDAGRVLSPGGVLIIFMMPFVGRVMSKIDLRYLLAIGFVMLSASLFRMVHVLSTDLDFHSAVMLRLYQAAGLAFFFVPISTMAYTDVPLEKNNAVAGMINLSRNMGGDIGIAIVTTMAQRRLQFHQSILGAHITRFDADVTRRLQGIASSLQQTGAGAAEASSQALTILYRSVQQQAGTLAYVDVIWVLALFSTVMIPLVFLMKKSAGHAPAAH